MKVKIIMRIVSVLVGISTIYIVFLYEPKEKSVDNEYSRENLEESLNASNEDNDIIEKNDSDKNNEYDMLTIDLDYVSDKLTGDEKDIVKNILSKLSVVDCAKVNKLLREYGDNSKREAFLYIKKRLLSEDYRRLEGILNQYIDLV